MFDVEFNLPHVTRRCTISSHLAHLNIDAVELIKAAPRATSCQALEKLCHSEVVQSVGAIEYDTLETKTSKHFVSRILENLEILPRVQSSIYKFAE